MASYSSLASRSSTWSWSRRSAALYYRVVLELNYDPARLTSEGSIETSQVVRMGGREHLSLIHI